MIFFQNKQSGAVNNVWPKYIIYRSTEPLSITKSIKQY